MKAFFKWLWTGQYCKHKWKTIKVQTVVDQHDAVIGTNVILECEKCGEVTNRRV